MSPPGGLTLITSAPWSARNIVANGPDTTLVRSMTRTPDNGPVMRRLPFRFSTYPDDRPAASQRRRSHDVTTKTNPRRSTWFSYRTCVKLNHALEQAGERGVLGGAHGVGDRRPLDPADPARLLPARAPLRGIPGAARGDRAAPGQSATQAGEGLRAGQGALPGAAPALRVPADAE